MSNTTYRLLSIMRREVLRIATKPMYLFCMIIAPVFCYVFFATLMGSGLPTDLPAGVVDLDNTSTTRNIIRNLDAFQQTKIVAHYSSLSDSSHRRIAPCCASQARPRRPAPALPSLGPSPASTAALSALITLTPSFTRAAISRLATARRLASLPRRSITTLSAALSSFLYARCRHAALHTSWHPAHTHTHGRTRGSG